MTDATNHNQAEKPKRKIASYSAWILIFAGLLLIVIYWIQPDRLVPVTMIPPWFWFVLFLISCVLIRHRTLKYGLAIWLFFAFLHVEEVRSLTRYVISNEEHVGQSVRVASLNCNVGNNLAAKEALATDSDIYLIQESPSEGDLKKLVFKDSETALNFVWNADTSIAVRGTIQAEFIDKSSHFCHVVAILNSGQAIDIVCLRLSAPVFRLDFWTAEFWNDHYQKRIHHRQQLTDIVEHLKKNQQTPYLIIGGDFNSVAQDGALTTTLTNCYDSFAAAGIGWGGTGTNEFPVFRVDQVWVSENMGCVKSQSIKTKNSDHRLVVAEVEFSN